MQVSETRNSLANEQIDSPVASLPLISKTLDAVIFARAFFSPLVVVPCLIESPPFSF